MQVQQGGGAAALPPPQTPSAPRERMIKPEKHEVADTYSGSRRLGNYVSGMITGAAVETATATAQSPLLVASAVKNLWKAETIGPNLKTIGMLAALPGTALTVAVSPLVGAVRGVIKARDHRYEGHDPLAQDTSVQLARELTVPNSPGEPVTFAGSVLKGLDEFGNRKLGEGQKPFDVPLLSPAFAVAGGALSGVIGGAVGLVAGTVAGSIAGGKDIVAAFTAPDLTMGQRAGKVAAAPFNLVVGPVLAWKSVKEAVPRGLSDGWKHGVYRPVADTVRISGTLGMSVIREAWEK